MFFVLTAPPLQEVRDAVWARLTTDPETSGYTWMKEGRPAGSPYLALGATYLGEGGTDPDFGVNVVVQIDAVADADDGGSSKVSEMISDVYAAVSSSAIPVPGFGPLTPTVEADVLNANLQDAATRALYAQRFVRFRFLITT